MSESKAKASRRAERDAVPPAGPGARSSFWWSWRGGAVAAVVVALLAASFVLPGVFDGGTARPVAGPHDMGMQSMAAGEGEGLPAGSAVPRFAERDVETGRPITSRTVYRHRTLLFFSEGVMCQACFQQIKGLEAFGAGLRDRGIRLVSITPDPPSELQRAIRAYGITTPMIADDDRDMSAAFNTLGRGMHSDTPGHAFALVEKGKVLWYRDYWLPPDRSMYVEPAKLLAAIP